MFYLEENEIHSCFVSVPPGFYPENFLGQRCREFGDPMLAYDPGALAAAISGRMAVPKRLRRLHLLLLEIALTVADRQNLSARTSQISFFLPLDLVAAVLNCHRTTVWRQMTQLEKLKIAFHQPLINDTAMGRITVGTVWWINLRNPGPKFAMRDDFCTYRDIVADIGDGATAFAIVGRHNAAKQWDSDARLNVGILTEYVLCAQKFAQTASATAKIPVAEVTTTNEPPAAAAAFGTLLRPENFDLSRVPYVRRPQAINAIARRISCNFSKKYIGFWRRAVWAAHRAGALAWLARTVCRGIASTHDGVAPARAGAMVGADVKRVLMLGN